MIPYLLALSLIVPPRFEKTPRYQAPRLHMGHGFAILEHFDGSMEMVDVRMKESGVFISGPRQNWWPKGHGPKRTVK